MGEAKENFGVLNDRNLKIDLESSETLRNSSKLLKPENNKSIFKNSLFPKLESNESLEISDSNFILKSINDNSSLPV